MTALIVGAIAVVVIWGLFGRFGLGLLIGLGLGLLLAATPAGPWLTDRAAAAATTAKDGAPAALSVVQSWIEAAVS